MSNPPPLLPVPAEGTAPVLSPAAIAVETFRPFALSLDWLTVNMDAPQGHAFDVAQTTGFVSDLDRTEQFWIVPRGMGTPAFHRCVDVLDCFRDKAMTIQFRPRSTAWRPEWCQVQFANATLYTGQWVKLFRVLRAMGFTLDSISKVDVAADAHVGDGGGFMDVLNRRMAGELKYYGKGNWSPFMRRDGTDGFRVGEKSSDKFVRCYNKTKEMKRNPKPYIKHRWALALDGEDPDTLPDVHRFEASLKGKGVRRYVGTRERDERWLLSLATAEPLVSLFASMAPSLFDFRAPMHDRDGKQLRARDAVPVTAWDFSRIIDGDPEIDLRAARNHVMKEDELKRACRYIFIAALGMASPEAGAIAEGMAKAGNVVEWYARKRQEWFRQYGKMIAGGDAATLKFFANLAMGADNSPSTMGEVFGLD